MSLGDILDGAFKLFKADAATVIVVTLAFTAPLQLLAAYVQRDALGVFDALLDPQSAAFVDPATVGGDPLPSLVATLITMLVLPFVAGAVARIVGDSYLGRPTGAGVALRAAGRRWWSLLAGWFLVHVVEGIPVLFAGALAAVGVATSLVPLIVLGVLAVLGALLAGVFIMPLFVAVAPIIVMEDIGAVAAMRRSYRLLRPRYGPVLGIALLTGILSSLLGSALGTVPMIGAFLLGSAGWPLLAVGGLLANLVVVPIVAIVSTLIYFDGRIRQEGFDLQVMAAELAGARAS
ncbi:MAG TPA: hypothetical protein VHF25_10110 [Nitriliruptorales bacterium]|nr:hypothetical protein [Nitriliruptorales bacterium]